MVIGLTGLLALGGGVAHAGPKREVREAFAQWEALGAAFDPALGDRYRDDARLHVIRARADGQTQTLTMSGAELKQMLGPLLDEARALGDADSFTGVKVARDGDDWRITATRTNHLKCYADPAWAQVWRQGDDGAWRIASEFLGTQELSSCDGAGSPLSQVLATQERVLQQQLPVQIDEITFMSGVDVVDDTLTYRVSLPSVPAAGLDVELFTQTVQEMARASACQSRDPRLLLDLGATLVVSYTDRDGVVFAQVRTRLDDCL